METYKDIAQTAETGIDDRDAERGRSRAIASAAFVIARLVFSLFAILTSAYFLTFVIRNVVMPGIVFNGVHRTNRTLAV